MFGPFVDSWQWIKSCNPGSPLKKRHMNFITIHYIYILGLTIVGSILIFPAGNLDYTDALFFASGCATQSGLNTVDINKLNTYQQVVLYLITMIATPIFIHTFVVFIRLYWFERRFQHIAREARHLRHARTRSRTKTQVKNEVDTENEEKGVRGRSIVVLHKNGGADSTEDGSVAAVAKKLDESEATSASSSSHEDKLASDKTGVEAPLDQAPSLHREVTFADELDEVGELKTSTQRLPLRQSAEEHIAFLEKQRNPQGKSTLRIPGPRDFDQGHVPETVAEDEDGGALGHKTTSPIEDSMSASAEPIRRNITIDEPKHPRQRAGTGLSKISVPSHRSNYIAHAKTTSPDGQEEDDGRPLHSARLKARTGTFESLRHWGTREPEPLTPYLSWQPTIGRNSAFVDLTEEQREELGGIEYRSLKTLAIVLVSYYVLIHITGAITYTPWIVETDSFGSVVDSAGINRVWWGIFTSQSMFNDLGFTLTPDSMISFQRAVLPLFLGTFLIVIGNTGFPCMLRFVIWLLSKVMPRESGTWEELKFLLDHPRRCFTLLFPTDATAWLFWILVVLNGLDVILYIVLDLHDPVVTQIGSVGYRLLNGLFQASSTRTAGFATVNLANLHPGIQVSYMVMMYISVFPIAISVRRTNVYEEKSLGIYTNGGEDDEHANEPSYVGAHLRRQLSFDLWYIFLGLFVIAIAEGDHISNMNEDSFTMYSCLFEIVSAYGTVGLSLGYPDKNTSFCGQFSVVSKLVIIAMQIRGRHRGLPYELDRAILLPSESLHKKEDADAARRLQRRNSSLSNIVPTGSGLHRQPTTPSEAGHASTTGREHRGHSARESFVGNSGHSGKAGSLVGKMMAGLAAGPHFERRP
ncbi:MAG: hypothetical protein L6R38_002558 [Xanthoria sp. 2 TBL-2021]|nr:MAG: hypothetical protein L6R38_002558 [Xanthoria sp. 2 TBL-2021]